MTTRRQAGRLAAPPDGVGSWRRPSTARCQPGRESGRAVPSPYTTKYLVFHLVSAVRSRPSARDLLDEALLDMQFRSAVGMAATPPLLLLRQVGRVVALLTVRRGRVVRQPLGKGTSAVT